MGCLKFLNFFKKQIAPPLEWIESDSGVLVQRLNVSPLQKKIGGELVVRETQVALLVANGEVTDLFESGSHTLPPFQSELFFFSLREQLNQRWGTATPILVEDKKHGSIRVRAHGVYSYRLRNPKIFFAKVSGTKDVFRTEDLEGQLRSAILTELAPALSADEFDLRTLSANQKETSELLKTKMSPLFSNYGLTLEGFFIQSFSLPEELQQRLETESPLEKIEKLHALVEKGVLTQAEFELKKAELLKQVT